MRDPRPPAMARAMAFGVAVLVAAAITPGAGASARADAQTPGTLEDLVGSFQEEFGIPGMVVGLTGPGGDRVRAFGVADAGTAEPVTAETRFEIGSVTKLLTGLLLAEMAVRGEVGLDDDVAGYLPDDAAAPSRDGRSPTLRQLSNHTSGLPRLPVNLQPENLADPYAGYDADRLYAGLDGLELAAAPGSRYEYSNLAAGLLGDLLARRAGAPYGDLLRERVLAPLGLDATDLPAASDGGSAHPAHPGLARGHAGGQPVSYWRFGVLEGAGGLRSTVRDMLRLVRAQLDPDATPLGRAIRLTQEAEPTEGGPAMGLGWHALDVPDLGRLFWHLGGTGGFRSFVAFVPSRGVGLVVLANGATPLPAFDRFAGEILMLELEGAVAGASEP